MLGNLKLVLLQHKKFLAVFFTVVFLPAIILGFFGIRAIQNERYKHQQLNLELQRKLVRELKTEIQSFMERTSLGLKELSLSQSFIDLDYPAIKNLIEKKHQNGSLTGHIVVWNLEETLWLPGLQAKPAAPPTADVPQEWINIKHDLESAEIAEFRQKNYPDASSRYKQILNKTKNRQVRAWIMSRVARCEVKQKKFEQAVKTYRSVIVDFSDLSTESGRPLGLVSRMEILNAIGLNKNYKSFFLESVKLYEQLKENIWFLDGNQISFYAAMLKTMIEDVTADSSQDDIPDRYTDAIKNSKNVMDNKLEIWNMAEIVRQNILPGIDEDSIQKNSIAYRNQEVLVFCIPLNGKFLGSLLMMDDLTKNLAFLEFEDQPLGVSVLLRSILTDKIIFGDGVTGNEKPVITDLFPKNFPPWRVEIYQKEGGTPGSLLYKNIFFWIILAMLFVLLVGSGLIIRSIIHEVNLLNLKSDFIASVSHEFKTPLTSMGLILEQLMGSHNNTTDKTKEYYRVLRHDSEKLKRLVKNVLDFTKIEKGKREYTLAATDIPVLIRNEVESYTKENNTDDIRFELNIDDNIPSVLVDAEALSQAVHNLLDNAVKFSDKEKKVSVELIQKEGIIEIAVKDNGIGIPENEQKKVFEKFYRGKQAHSVSPTGTGLGLTLVKHIMKAHGGNVAVQSQPGKGSCISLILPIRKQG